MKTKPKYMLAGVEGNDLNAIADAAIDAALKDSSGGLLALNELCNELKRRIEPEPPKLKGLITEELAFELIRNKAALATANSILSEHGLIGVLPDTINEPSPDEIKAVSSLKEIMKEEIEPGIIELVKKDLGPQATMEVVEMAAKLRILDAHTYEHSKELRVAGFELRADEAAQRAGEYNQAYWALCRIWPSPTTEAMIYAEKE